MNSINTENSMNYVNLLYANKERATMFFYSKVESTDVA